MVKKFIGVVVPATVLCFTPVIQASAAEPYSIVSPLYEIADDAQSRLHISGSTASCRSVIDLSSTVKITAGQNLRKQGFLWVWSTYDGAEWTKTVNGSSIAAYNSKSGLANGKYRLKTIFTLTDKNGKKETITVYSDEKKVG